MMMYPSVQMPNYQVQIQFFNFFLYIPKNKFPKILKTNFQKLN